MKTIIYVISFLYAHIAITLLAFIPLVTCLCLFDNRILGILIGLLFSILLAISIDIHHMCPKRYEEFFKDVK